VSAARSSGQRKATPGEPAVRRLAHARHLAAIIAALIFERTRLVRERGARLSADTCGNACVDVRHLIRRTRRNQPVRTAGRREVAERRVATSLMTQRARVRSAFERALKTRWADPSGALTNRRCRCRTTHCARSDALEIRSRFGGARNRAAEAACTARGDRASAAVGLGGSATRTGIAPSDARTSARAGSSGIRRCRIERTAAAGTGGSGRFRSARLLGFSAAPERDEHDAEPARSPVPLRHDARSEARTASLVTETESSPRARPAARRGSLRRAVLLVLIVNAI